MKKPIGLVAITLLMAHSQGSIRSTTNRESTELDRYQKKTMLCLSQVIKKSSALEEYQRSEEIISNLQMQSKSKTHSLSKYKETLNKCYKIKYSKNKSSGKEVLLKNYKARSQKVKSIMLSIANSDIYTCKEGLTKKSSLQIYKSRLMTCSNTIGKSFAISKNDIKLKNVKTIRIDAVDRINLLANIEADKKEIKGIEIHPLKFDKLKFKKLL